MTYLKTLTAAAAFALAVPAAATLSPAGTATAAADPTGLASSTTTTTSGPTSDDAGVFDGSAVTATREPSSDILASRRTVVGELDRTDEPPARFGDLFDAGRRSEGGPAGGPDSISAGPWCNAQCITKGVAYKHGSGVELVVETSVHADILVSIWLDEDGDYQADPGTPQGETSPGMVTELSWVPEDLKPGATYYGTVWATDMYGNTSYGWGTFTVPS